MTSPYDAVFYLETGMLVLAFTVCAYATYTDFRFRLIYNFYTYSLLFAGLACQLCLVYLLEGRTVDQVLLLLLAGFAVAWGLMEYGFWSPGDAKLFWAVLLAMPPTLFYDYEITRLSLDTPLWALVVNSSLCFLLVLLPAITWRRYDDKGAGQVASISVNVVARTGLRLMALAGLLLLATSALLDSPLSHLQAFGTLLISYRLLTRLVGDEYWPGILVPGILASGYVGYAFTILDHIAIVVVGAWLAEVLLLYVQPWYKRALVQRVAVDAVHPGAVLRTPLALAGDGATWAAGSALSRVDSQRLRDLVRTGAMPKDATVEIEQSIPYAPFMFVGAILTVLFSGSLISVLGGVFTLL